MSDLVFRRINGRIIPIKRKDLSVTKDQKKGIAITAGGGAVAMASGFAAAKIVRKATFSFRRSASLRGASLLAMKGSAKRASLITASAAAKVIGKRLSNKGFGLLLIGSSLGAGIASYGVSKALGDNVSKERKIAAAGTIGSIVAGLGIASFGKIAKMSSLSRFMKVTNPKQTVGDAFDMYSREGAKKTMHTIKKFGQSTFSFGKGVTAQNIKASKSTMPSAAAFGTLRKMKKPKGDPNQGTLF
jgi:hypothetical protein